MRLIYRVMGAAGFRGTAASINVRAAGRLTSRVPTTEYSHIVRARSVFI